MGPWGLLIRAQEGDDNYLGELAAQIDAFNSLNAGSRVVVVFDAQSPIRALHTFRSVAASAFSAIP